MSIVADFSLPRREFLLGGVSRDWSGRVEFETAVPTRSDPFPFVVVAGDTEAFVASARADSAVDSLVEVDAAPSWARYRLTWTPRALRAIRSLLDDVVVVEAVATREWTFSLRFPEFDDVSVFREAAAESGLRLELNRLHEASRTEGVDADLTDLQRETLAVAVRRGYFEMPRSTTLSDISDELGVSKQAVSGRLRRAVALLAADVVNESPPTE